jgi:hypothetical protein
MAKLKKADKIRLEELEDLRAVMSTGPGFRFMKRLINITGPYRSNFNTDHAVHSFLDGERNVGARVLSDMLEASPDMAVRILIESASKKTEEAGNETHIVEETTD